MSVTESPAARLTKLEVALVALCAASALAAAWLQPLWQGHLDVRCPLLALFGIPCVTCGGTRAMVALVTGHGVEALAWNPMVALGGIAAVACLPLAALMLVGRLDLPRIPTVLPAAVRRAAIAGSTPISQ